LRVSLDAGTEEYHLQAGPDRGQAAKALGELAPGKQVHARSAPSDESREIADRRLAESNTIPFGGRANRLHGPGREPDGSDAASEAVMNSCPPTLLVLASLGVVAALAAFPGAAAAGPPVAPVRVGDRLPLLEGEFLTGRDARLPDAATGKVALVLMGFTYDSRYPGEAWAGWFRATYGEAAGVTFFEVPVIGGMGRLGRWFIDAGMRRGTPRALHENVITVYGGSDRWKRRLAVTADKDAYLLVLDAQGVVRWMHHGPFDEERARDLRTAIDALAGS
jgi:hypothetical protein